ncbi:MAG: manganese efflux pump [Lachnospiraceae bacterium]|uniref:manganese efflux pump MntP n=1 Tax=Porcincola sp. LCP21S3_C12 TaxID=3438798 RepID=UPI0029715547|nr:manganese efflux pump [Lachnospiraceae bacterium]
MGQSFFLNSILLGAGLAMDAFSVSCANGLREPDMKAGRMVKIAGVYAFFQFAMPMAGWFCVHQLLTFFRAFQPFIPWIALGLLGWIGGKMLIEGMRNQTPEEEACVTRCDLLVQGIATSIDALSIGFTISDYHAIEAFLCALIIAAVTEGICIAGLAIGKRVGMKLSSRASVLGGVILIAIGLEVFISGIR